MGNKDGFDNVLYMTVQSVPEEPVYSLTSGSLPSHIRQISPKQRTNDALDSDIIKHKPWCTTKVVYLTLTLIFIVSSSIAVTIAAVEISAIYVDTEIKILEARNETYRTALKNIQNTKANPEKDVTSIAQQPRRTRCAVTCLAYTQPKFRSRCEAGHCVCEGVGYQKDTCLPNFEGCKIRSADSTQSEIYMASKRANSFKCKNMGRTTIGANVHVIGIYGNHYSKQTVVNIGGGCSKPLIIVLASHYSVTWRLQHEQLNITKVYLISDWNPDSLQLEIDNTTLTNNVIKPVTEKLFLPFGFGDDKNNLKTTEMLGAVSGRIGKIASFTGASFADKMSVEICRDS